jgi:aldehyde:ferredoxin oxidoreductase
MYYEMFQLWKVMKSLPRVKPLYFKGRKYVADEEKAAMAAACSKFMNVVNCAGLCMFGVFLGAKRIPAFDWLNAATGWHRLPEHYMKIGERIQTLKQAFNIRQGVDPRTFWPGGRVIGRPPQTKGANRGRSINMEKMISDYYTQFGWDPETGRPTEKTMARLGLGAGEDVV